MYRTEIRKRSLGQHKSISKILKYLCIPILICHLTSFNIFGTFWKSTFFAAAQTTQSPGALEYNQSWQDWNYYQLLNLLPEDYYNKQGSSKFRLKSKRERKKERSVIQTKDIKKAYRKQAQLWHPDKIQSRKNQQTNATSTNGIDYASLSDEECNRRFAKLAEAYEVLNNDEKRRDYDSFLLDAEDQMERDHDRDQKRQPAESATASDQFFQYTNTFKEFFTDPMSTFEEFFFGSGDGDDQGNDRSFMEDIFDSFYAGSQRNHEDNQSYNQQPDRTSETTQVTYDPRFGTEVLRVLHREEFDRPQESQTYFRVIGQKFIEEFDPIYGRSLGYQPITEPYIVEEGYLQYKKQRKKSESFNDQQRRKDPKHRTLLVITSHRLEKYEFITPKSIHIHSTNGEYYAGLTPECELVIMHDEGPFEEDTEMWGSNTFVPPQHRDGCALAMYGARIAIVVGNVENPTTVLWTSPPPPPIVPGSPFDGEEIIDFYCSLDDDGSLSVYRTRERKKFHVSRRDLVGIAEMWWTDLVTGEAPTPPNSKAANTWKSIQRWTHLKIRGKPTVGTWAREERKSPEVATHVDECVFATGPAGCNTAGRHVVNISKTIKRYAEKAVSQIDGKVGGFVDSIYDGGEDDIDVFDTFLRVASNAIRRVYTPLARATQLITPQLAEIIMEMQYRVSKWSNILYYETMDFVRDSGRKFRKLKKYLKRKLDDVMNHQWEI